MLPFANPQNTVTERDSIKIKCNILLDVNVIVKVGAGQTLSRRPNTMSYNLDNISELLEGAYVRAFSACILRA